MQEATGLGETPALFPLKLEMRVNTADEQILSNLEYVKSRNLPELKLTESHAKTLAIVGGGPSLKGTWGLIPRDCDVMALNGAYKFLLSKGVRPAYFAMLDARECNSTFIEHVRGETAFLLASQCHPNVIDRIADDPVLGGPLIFHLATATSEAVFPSAALRIGGGGTIGLTALGIALALGYRKVLLYGYDSSFDGGATHAFSQPQNAGLNEIEVWVEDRKYITTHAMAAQTMDFFPFYEAIKKAAPDFEIQLIGSGLFYDYIVTSNKSVSINAEQLPQECL